MGEGRGIYSVAMFHVAADDISFAATFLKVTSHSFCRGSSPNRTRFAGLRFGFGCKPESHGIYTAAMFHVGASFISLAPTFFKSQPLTLGCDLYWGANLKAAAPILLR